MEQPLPPHGACLLGSFNLTKYVVLVDGVFKINYHLLKKDIPPVVRMMDNTVDRTIYPLEEQKLEALSKRRMGLGVTGVANAIEACGFPYTGPLPTLLLRKEPSLYSKQRSFLSQVLPRHCQKTSVGTSSTVVSATATSCLLRLLVPSALVQTTYHLVLNQCSL